MENEKEYAEGMLGGINSKISRRVLEKTLTEELSGELLIPEYKPAIRRVISVQAVPAPPSKYIGGGRAELAGGILYTLIYEGEGGELCAERISGEYDLSLAADAAGDAVLCSDIYTEALSAHPEGPRKVTFKCRLRAPIEISEDTEPETELSGLQSPGDLRRLCRGVSYAEVRTGLSEPIELSDSVIPDDNGEGELRVICAVGSVFVASAEPVRGGVSMRGEVTLKLMLCRDTDMARPFAMQRKLPFSESVAIDTDGDGTFIGARAWGALTSLSAAYEEGRLLLDMSLLLEAEIMMSCEASVTEDIYSVAQLCDVRHTEEAIYTPTLCRNCNFTVSGGVPYSELSLDGGVRLLDSYATVGELRALPADEGRRTALEGSVRLTLLYDDGATVSAKGSELPMRYVIDAPFSESVSYCHPTVVSSRVRGDGERIGVDCELALALKVMGLCRVKRVASVEFGETRRPSRSTLTVYYPTESDSLWSVAKRYGSDVGRLSRQVKPTSASPDSPETLSGVKFLIV